VKLAVIGGGSTYTPELAGGLIARAESFPLRELWLADIDQTRLEVVGGFVARMVEAAGAPFEVILTVDRRAALDGAAYVITQMRVGQMAARRADEYLGRRHGLIGQETTGVGGLAKALRTIPVLLEIAAEMRALAPGAPLFNFTNPAGLVTEALARHAPEIPAVGVCNVPITTTMQIVEGLRSVFGEGIDPAGAALDTLGLNHLTWHRGFRLDGQDLWPQVFAGFLERVRSGAEEGWDPATIEALGMIPNYYLQYYYYPERKLAEQLHWPPSRAEQVMEIEHELLAYYDDARHSTPPDLLMQRGGAYYSTLAAQLLDAHYNDRGERHVINVAHKGAVPGWPADWVLELPCRVDRAGFHPLPAEALPPAQAGLAAAVKAYELLAVQAAVTGDRQALHLALLAHPLGPSADRIEPLVDDLLSTHRAHLPQFR